MGDVRQVERRVEHLPLLHARRGHLALALVLMGVLVLGGALWPLSDRTPVSCWYTVSILYAVLAVVLMVLPEREWIMPVALGIGIVGAGVLTAGCQTSEGMAVIAVGVIAAAQFAMYAFPGAVAAVELGLCLAAVSLGMLVAPAPFHLVSWAVIVVVMSVSTLLLGYAIHWLRRYATTDDLTGALSRGALMQRLDAELRDAQRTGISLAVISADVDHFKTINDTRGHLAGDEVLVDLVREWRNRLGPRDVVGRTGGDEFVMLLPGRGRTTAQSWLDDARAHATVPWSAGLAVCTRTDTALDLLDRADVALYEQKAARPNPSRSSASR
ncbi:MAG TPA: GGDEF domain-containing protein [Cellulomonas sp.]